MSVFATERAATAIKPCGPHMQCSQDNIAIIEIAAARLARRRPA